MKFIRPQSEQRRAKVLRLTSVPSILKAVDDDEAALIVTEINLNPREKLLPNEKAIAYKV